MLMTMTTTMLMRAKMMPMRRMKKEAVAVEPYGQRSLKW
jgi:hypothetical protein